VITVPGISHDRFSDLVAFVGGERPAARLLGVRPSEIKRWKQLQQVPHWAGALLWFHTAEARNSIAEDLATELRYVAGERDALRGERERHRSLIDESRASMAARLRALEQENNELRLLLQSDLLTKRISEAQQALDSLLVVLKSKERVPHAA
jgi:hypothetical protein